VAQLIVRSEEVAALLDGDGGEALLNLAEGRLKLVAHQAVEGEGAIAGELRHGQPNTMI
jgi:hypothetical protein